MNRFRTRVVLALGRRIERLGRARVSTMYYQTVRNAHIDRTPNVQFRLGFSQYKCKRYNEALESIEAALAADPNQPGWIYTRALTLRRLKRLDEALELFAEVCSLRPENFKWRVSYAKAARAAGQPEMATSILDQLVSQFPHDPAASAVLADFLLSIGQRWRELDVRVEHEALHAHDALWMLRTAEAASFMSRFELAREYFAKATTLDPDSVRAWYGLGLSCMELKLHEEADLAYAKAVLVSSDEKVQVCGVGRLHHNSNRWALALEAYDAALAKSELANPWLVNYCAGEVAARLFELGRAADYFAAAQEVATTNEERVRAGYARARAQIRNEDYAPAADSLAGIDPILEDDLNVDLPVLHFRRAHALHELGRYAEAADIYERAANFWGYLDDRLKESKGAGIRANEHLRAAIALEERADWLGAAEAYADALWHASSTERAWQGRAGRAFARAGRIEQACIYYLGMLLFTEISVAGLGKALKGTGRRRGALAIHGREVLPLDKKLVLFESSHGKNVHCHPYALYKAMRADERFAEFRFAWVFNDLETVPEQLSDDPDVAIVKQHSDRYIKLLGTAKYLVNNATFPTYFARREGQQVLNTWHGTPLKFMGKLVKEGVAEHRNVQRNFMQTTHLMVPNLHTLKTLSTDHDLEGLFPAQVALTGSPRVDSMINLSPLRRAQILSELGLSPTTSEKIVLFAPTWRGQLGESSFDVDSLISDVQRMADGSHKLLFRAHRFAEQLIGDAELDATVVPSSIDTNELLAVVDVLITDYSSIFYDYLPRRKPIIFYTPDFAEYEAARGLYFAPETWPGEVLADIDDVAAEIARVLERHPGDEHRNLEKNVQDFAPMEDGAATGRVLDFFFFGDQQNVLEPLADTRTKLLFYQGPFKPNGIATAFTNLIGALDPEKYLVAVAVDMNAVARNAGSLEILQSLPDHVRILPRAGATIMSAEERWVSDSYHANRGFDSPEAERIHLSTMRREMHRSFGLVQFDMAIDFEGYSRFWASLFSAAHSHAAKTGIYLHNDMVGEWLLRFGTMPGLFATYRHFDALISVTDSVGELNQKQLSERFDIDSSLFTVSENLLDIEKPARWAELEDPVHSFDGDDLTVFANMARLSPEKGQSKLLKAFMAVHEQDPRTRLLLIGDGPLRSVLEEEITRHGLEGKVVITGLLSNPFPTLRSADCFVFSSDYEGQGLAMIEALMLGLPAISTDVVGSHSVLVDGYGMLVENSVQGLIDGMQEYLSGYQAPKKFDPAAYQAQALAQFETLVSGQAATTS
ncbi:CDP-glycerol glycerophosphotransferase family protein [Glutamicibacter endophyticus]